MLRLVALAVTLLLLLGGSTLAGCALIPAEPVPLVPFGDFEVGHYGGVAGVQDVLHVRADGVALLVTRKPAAGRLSEATMDRLRTLLESEEFRREAATAASDHEPPRCADLMSTSVRMGSLAMSVEEPCGSASQPATPAFDEILELTGPAQQGQFTEPVGVDEPRLVGVRLERSAATDQTGYVITITPDGIGTLAIAAVPQRQQELTTAERDTLRLLLARLAEQPVTACTTEPRYRLEISGAPGSSGADCGYRERYREFAATIAVLETAFRL
jgi:hypothetical protein